METIQSASRTFKPKREAMPRQLQNPKPFIIVKKIHCENTNLFFGQAVSKGEILWSRGRSVILTESLGAMGVHTKAYPNDTDVVGVSAMAEESATGSFYVGPMFSRSLSKERLQELQAEFIGNIIEEQRKEGWIYLCEGRIWPPPTEVKIKLGVSSWCAPEI